MSDPSELKPKSNFRGTPYEEWVVDNPFEDELESRTKHLNNLRQEYIDAGAYTEDTELRFQDAFKQRLIREDILTPSNEGVVYDAVNEYTGLAANAQDNVDFIRSRVDDIEFEKGEEEKVLRYISAVDLGEELPEDFDVDGAEEIIREKRQDYITDLFEKDELGAGIYYDKEGNRVFLGGKVGENLSEGDVIKQGAEFGVTPLDVFNLRQKRTIREDRNNLPVYKIEQREAAEAKIRVFLDPLDTLEDDYIKAAFDALALNLAKEKSWGWLDKSVDSTGEVLNWMGSHIKSSWNFWTFDKKEMDETDAKRRFESLREQMEDEVDETKRRLMGDLQKRTGVSGEILEDVVDDIIRQTAAYGSNTQDASLNFTDDEDDLAENVLRMKYKPAFVQEGLHLYPEKFKKALADSGFSEKEIEIEDGRRVTSNEMLADGRIAALMLDDDYSTELNRRVIQGTQKGLSKGEILEQFVIDEDPNLGLAGIGMSIGQSVSTLWYGGGALFGFDWGKEGLIQNSKDQAHLQQMRTIFGQEAGTGQQLLEQAAPLLVDGVITVGAGLLAPVSAGTSVAAAGGYFGAKATGYLLRKTEFLFDPGSV